MAKTSSSYQLSEAGKNAAALNHVVHTMVGTVQHRIDMVSITDAQMKILADKNHIFIEGTKQ